MHVGLAVRDGVVRMDSADADHVTHTVSRAVRLLTEQEVSRSWARLLKGIEITDEVLDKAEALLDELRPESPLRHRLEMELDELRQRVG